MLYISDRVILPNSKNPTRSFAGDRRGSPVLWSKALMLSSQYQVPALLLQPYVQFYTQREMRLRDPVIVQPVPARGAPMLEFVYGDPFRVTYLDSGHQDTCPRVVLVGMQTRPWAQLHLQGALGSFVIMFQPAGLDVLFPVPMNELTDHDYDAYSILGRQIEELDHRLGDCNSFAERVLVCDSLLLCRAEKAPPVDRIAAVTYRIRSGDGRVRIPEIAAWAGLSTRQLEREFASRFGMGPKLFSRITRFQAALDRKARSSKSWTEVAHELGYHDQMHMIHDFQNFSADSPSESLRVVEMLFRRQIEAIRTGTGAKDTTHVPRFII
jgi:AraC-like DNA-binding protein